ncbi:MAG: tetratricopeptide repeat protein [Magnetococcales bacterium]|nr:tetratricopeptide repeat protein [Magnetococcales bacterium]
MSEAGQEAGQLQALQCYLGERLDDIERQIAAIREQAELRAVGGLYGQSDGYSAAGDLAAARRVTAEEMGQALIWQSEAVEWMTRDDPMQAEAAIRAALRINPDSSEACFTLGWILHETGRHAEAEALYRLTLERAPHHVGAWFNLGNVLMRFQQGKEAIAAWRQAADLGHEEAERRCAALLNQQTDESGKATAHNTPTEQQRRGAFSNDSLPMFAANILPEQQQTGRLDRNPSPAVTTASGWNRFGQLFWRRVRIMILLSLVGVLMVQLWWMLFR